MFERKIAVKCLILILLFRCVQRAHLPPLRDNVIRDEVLYVSYQFSFKTFASTSLFCYPERISNLRAQEN